MSFWEVLLNVLLCGVGPWPSRTGVGEDPVWMAWLGGALVIGAVVALAVVLAIR